MNSHVIVLQRNLTITPLTEKTNGAPALKGGVPSYDNHEDMWIYFWPYFSVRLSLFWRAVKINSRHAAQKNSQNNVQLICDLRHRVHLTSKNFHSKLILLLGNRSYDLLSNSWLTLS